MYPSRTLLGKAARLLLSVVPRTATLPILRGPLRGKKWIAGAASNACWLGTYESTHLRQFAAAIPRGATVYDIGANVGIYSLLASECVGASGKVYSFEPVQRNLGFLRQHMALNNALNCDILENAVSDRVATLRFASASWEASMGRIAADGDLEVSAVSIDSCVYGEREFRPPTVMKIDVEGAEREVLAGAILTLSEFHPLLFVEIHGSEQHATCRDFLQRLGYNVLEEYGRLTATRPEMPAQIKQPDFVHAHKFAAIENKKGAPYEAPALRYR